MAFTVASKARTFSLIAAVPLLSSADIALLYSPTLTNLLALFCFLRSSFVLSVVLGAFVSGEGSGSWGV